MKKSSLMRTCAVLASAMLLGVSASSCVEETTDDQYCTLDANGVMNCDGSVFVKSIVVKTRPTSGDRGSLENPVKFVAPQWKTFASKSDCQADSQSREDGYGIEIAAYAVNVHGKYDPRNTYTGKIKVKAVPGELDVGELNIKNGLIGEWEFDGDGQPTQPKKYENIQLRYAYGPTRIWVEDAMEDPITGVRRSVLGKGVATGVSEEYVFESQTIRSIQYNPDQPDGTTPLIKQFGDVKARPGHDLVVSNVVSTGFYVTDIVSDESGDPKDFNSIFIFSYSQPSRVDIGDRVCEVTGGIAEFTGMTQMQFPSWGIQNKERSTAEDTDPAPEDGDAGAGSCWDKETNKTRPCTDEELANMSEIVDCWSTYYPERAAECSDVELDKKYGAGTAERANAKKQCKKEKDAFAFIDIKDPKIIEPTVIDWRHLFCGSDGNGSGDMTSCVKLESLEGGVVEVNNLTLSSYFINCDDNGNGKIESGTGEAECRTECNNNPKCTEYSNLDSYDQWKARVEGKTSNGETINSEISVASSSLIAGFDIMDGCVSYYDNDLRKRIYCQKRRISRLRGTLKQVLPGCYAEKINTMCCVSHNENIVMSVIEPRFEDDLILDEAYEKEQKAVFDACVADCEKKHNVYGQADEREQFFVCMGTC